MSRPRFRLPDPWRAGAEALVLALLALTAIGALALLSTLFPQG